MIRTTKARSSLPNFHYWSHFLGCRLRLGAGGTLMSLIELPSQSKYSHFPREVHPQQRNTHLPSLSFFKQDKHLRARGFLSAPRWLEEVGTFVCFLCSSLCGLNHFCCGLLISRSSPCCCSFLIFSFLLFCRWGSSFSFSVCTVSPSRRPTTLAASHL